MSMQKRAACTAALISFVLAVAACGDSEAEQRKAFIGFLQEVNGRSGVHFLIPTPVEAKAFGPYLQQYTLILDYDKDMQAPMDAFAAQLVKLGIGPASQPRTIEQMAATAPDLVAAKSAVEKMEQDIETRLAKLNADRGALKQSDDLKAVYDKTYDKLVTAPALAMETSAKALDAGLDASIKLTAYINGHRDKLTVSGMQIQAKDQHTYDDIAPLLKAHQDASERFAAARRDGERIVHGD